MIHFLYFPPVIALLIVSLLSCSGIEQKQVMDDAGVYETGIQLFPAWKPLETSRSSATANMAIRELLAQADVLISQDAMEQASDKLERLLRIEPAYAQAWSRLSWIALQDHAPERSRQLAQRSNSYAYENRNLKLLNWTFIRQASELMQDEIGLREAESMIDRLGGGV